MGDGVRVTILASGSKGNATLFESGGTSLLVDAGISVSEVAARAPRLDAVVVTHAHGDHTGNFRQLAKRLRSTVYMTEATARAKGVTEVVKRYGSREPFAVGPFTVSPLPLPHDAAQVGLVVSDGVHRVGLATDLGEVPPGLVGHLRGCDALLLESNHDIGRLLGGPYPPSLKQRIASARGHLSNDQLGELLRAHYRDAATSGLTAARTVVLMHLSEQNNRPEIALGQARDALADRCDRLLVASQHEPLDVPLGPALGQLRLFAPGLAHVGLTPAPLPRPWRGERDDGVETERSLRFPLLPLSTSVERGPGGEASVDDRLAAKNKVDMRPRRGLERGTR